MLTKPPPDVIQNVLDGKSDEVPKRGSELREFEKFLKKEDSKRTYSNKASGRAIWVTEESAKKIEKKEKESQNHVQNALEEAQKQANEAQKMLQEAEKRVEKSEEATEKSKKQNACLLVENEILKQQQSKASCNIL